MEQRLWNTLTYTQMFKNLMKKFGPFETWNGPKPPDKDGYDRFCEIFAETIGAKSGGAVNVQIAWITTKQKQVKHSHMSTFLIGKAVAIDTGFLKNKDLPKKLKCEY